MSIARCAELSVLRLAICYNLRGNDPIQVGKFCQKLIELNLYRFAASQVIGFYMRFEDDSLESARTVKQWNVNIISGNSLMRILNVAAFSVSRYASTEGRHCKPFNALLGETYEADYPDKGLRFFSEKDNLQGSSMGL
ncbi:hypothetical protein Scep_028076 [Stephania cephalantha]|uniref:Uncharacterized protein n=1 Tax=Stephania cephalantha TaxID=152367 RepID=A0AAP0HJ66_9MAGN